jgi:hypothetical protein
MLDIGKNSHSVKFHCPSCGKVFIVSELLHKGSASIARISTPSFWGTAVEKCSLLSRTAYRNVAPLLREK